MKKNPLFWFPLTVILLLFALAPVDTDLGWHLRYGEHILKTGSVMRANELTYFLQGYRWAHSYSLYQLLTALIYKTGGLAGLAVSFVLLMLATFWVFTRTNPRLKVLNVAAFLLIALSGWHTFNLGWRAQIFTFSGLVLTFTLLKKSAKKPAYLFLFPPLFALWANLHGGFVLGLLALSFFLLQETVKKKKVHSPLFLVLLASILAPLLNPFGAQIYSEILRQLQTPLGTLIAEWVAPKPALALSMLVAALFLLVLSAKVKNRNKIFWYLVVSAFLALAVQAKRHVPLFSLSLALATLDFFKKEAKAAEKKIAGPAAFLAFLALGIFLYFHNLPKTFSLISDWKTYCSGGLLPYPCRAVDYLRKNPPQGKNVFAAYEWGGFLAWQLPEYKYFVDGRMPAWPTPEGKSPYTIYLEIIQARPGYEERLKRYGTDWLLIGEGTFLDLALQGKDTTSWKEVFRSQTAVVYTRN